MHKKNLNKLIATAFIVSLGFAGTPAMAGQDQNQLQINQQFVKSQQKLKEAKAAKGAERKILMNEHMKMMHDTMIQMQDIKPKKDMTMQEHEDWINEHQKLMNQMLEQMMSEHHLLMHMGGMPMTKHSHPGDAKGNATAPK